MDHHLTLPRKGKRKKISTNFLEIYPAFLEFAKVIFRSPFELEMYPTPSLYPAGSLNMSSELIVNGVAYNVVQINGQKIAEATNYCGPSAPENAEIYINNIPVHWTEKELLPIITVPGFVVKLRLMMLFSGDNRGFCYVLYANTEMAHNALNFLMTQPILDTKLYVAWSHNNKNLIMTGIFNMLTREQILNKILSIVKPSKIDIRIGLEENIAILTFHTHREAAMARRSMILHVNEFGHMTRLRWLKPNSYFN